MTLMNYQSTMDTFREISRIQKYKVPEIYMLWKVTFSFI